MVDINPEDGADPAAGGAQRSGQETLKADAQVAREKLAQAGQTVKQEAAHFADTAKQKAAGEVDRRKEAVTGALGDFAEAIRMAGDQLGQKDQTMAARLVGQAAAGLETLSRTVSDKRPEEMLMAVRDFGRANPTAFLAGAVLAGLAIGRFARSSAEQEVEVVFEPEGTLADLDGAAGPYSADDLADTAGSEFSAGAGASAGDMDATGIGQAGIGQPAFGAGGADQTGAGQTGLGETGLGETTPGGYRPTEG